jgi:hypothetical protein
MKRQLLVILVTVSIFPVLLTGVNGCAGEGYEVAPGVVVPEPSSAPRPEPIAPSEPEADFSSADFEDVPFPEERIIVRNGDISLVVDDVPAARDEINELAVRLGGFVVNSNIYGDGEETRGWISIRIPSDQFDQALTELRALALRVSSESVSTQDVTEEYVDLNSRLRNAEATESQYLTLLDQAEAVEDILQIYEALTRIRNEIEQIKGRIQYLEQISAMSLISINLEPALALGPLVPPGWSASETLNSAVRGLTSFGQGLGTAFIWIGIFSPIWGTAIGVAYWRRRRKKKV